MTYRPEINHAGAVNKKWPYTGQPVAHDGLREDEFYHHAAAALKAELQETEADKWHKALAPKLAPAGCDQQGRNATRDTRVTLDEVHAMPWRQPAEASTSVGQDADPMYDPDYTARNLSRGERWLILAILLVSTGAMVSLGVWIVRRVLAVFA